MIVRENELETSVVYRDTFGNVKLAGLTSDLQAALPGLAQMTGSRFVLEIAARWARP